VPLLLLGPPFFSDYSFWVHHLVNWDDQHLLANAMASDFSVAWQCLSKRTIGFSLWIKLHALIRLGVSPPSFDTGARNGVLCGSRLKPLITGENWPGRCLNPGLPNDTPALYPLLHELMPLLFALEQHAVQRNKRQ
jgi:hypothetical protein